MYKQYLVTGATSQLGNHIVRMLLDQNQRVRVLVGPEEDTSSLNGMRIEVCQGEIYNKDSLKDFFKLDEPRESVLIHAEELVSISDKKNLEMRRINFSGTCNIVDMCLTRKIKRLVYLSSAYALPNDQEFESDTIYFDRKLVDGDYAQTKAEARAYVMEKVSLNKLNAVIILPTFIIGPGLSQNSTIGKVLKGYLENDVAPVKGGQSFVDVRDVAAMTLALAEKGTAGSGYIINGEYKTSVDFLNEVSSVKGIEKSIKLVPNWILGKTFGKLADTYFKICHKDNPKDVYALFLITPDVNYKSNVEGVIPEVKTTDLNESIKDTVMWLEG